MIEWIFPLTLAAAAAFPKGKPNDKKKIKMVFENVGYGIRKDKSLETPKYLKKDPIFDGEENIGTTYYFSLLPGLPATRMHDLERGLNIFSDYLRKPVEIEFNAKKGLMLHVYEEDLPDLFPYEKLPNRSDAWAIPLGRAVHGIVWHNFDHVPHMTAAGTTRFGKTVLLRMIMTYLIEHHPDDIELYLIDLKGGLEFGRYENLRQVKRVASNPEETVRLLSDLEGIYAQDYRLFREKYYSNIVDTGIKKRRFIIVDEAAQLAPEPWMDSEVKKQLQFCQTQLSKIAYLTGALGYRLIYATQYPVASTMPRMIKQNSDAKISFRLPSGYASEVAIDDYGAEKLPSNIKGRALFKTHEIKELQVPFISHEEMWQRLEQYQEPKVMEGEPENVINGKENPKAGEDIIQFRKA
jgi:DNA segregation ATPase FtsK/SpoIIIE, S-DNA-T family